MKWIIWNKTRDKYWDNLNKEWSNQYYATTYTTEELENNVVLYDIWHGDLILAVVAIIIN